MALEDWLANTPEQLIALRQNLSAGTPDAIVVDRILELKNAQQEAEANAKLIAATKALVKSTQRLGTVTWWLVAGTLLMGGAAAVDLIFKLVKGLH